MKRGDAEIMYLDWVMMGIGAVIFAVYGESIGLLVAGLGFLMHWTEGGR
jgi:hypothetical protein